MCRPLPEHCRLFKETQAKVMPRYAESESGAKWGESSEGIVSGILSRSLFLPSQQLFRASIFDRAI